MEFVGSIYTLLSSGDPQCLRDPSYLECVAEHEALGYWLWSGLDRIQRLCHILWPCCKATTLWCNSIHTLALQVLCICGVLWMVDSQAGPFPFCSTDCFPYPGHGWEELRSTPRAGYWKQSVLWNRKGLACETTINDGYDSNWSTIVELQFPCSDIVLTTQYDLTLV